ncbi:sensor histidine kinase [Streptomyces sp. SAS_270]|uniref:sensor histidine kinase n=1 Tax=Streptomyces sp. SAS_270 TaxID=3412748 RepID=UPI00403C3109
MSDEAMVRSAEGAGGPRTWRLVRRIAAPVPTPAPASSMPARLAARLPAWLSGRASSLLSGRSSGGATQLPSPVVYAVGLALLACVEVLARAGSLRENLSTALLLGLCTTLPLAFVFGVERVPVVRAGAAVALTAAGALALSPFRALTLAGVASQLACVYGLGRAGAPRLSGALVLPYVILALVTQGDTTTRVMAVLVATLASAAAATGIAHQVRGAQLAHSATEQAFADTLLAHAARGERARIARELHDVVAHHISMIAVQAESARLTTPGLPPDGAARLLAIGDTARGALTEMRRLLGVLREDAEVGVTRRPQPGLHQLMELIDESRDAAGSGTRLIVSGPVTPLDPGVEVTAYRIVQEALTNARRHAPGAAVDVELRYAQDDLRIRVRDNGPGPGRGSVTRTGFGSGSASGSGSGSVKRTGYGAAVPPTGHGLLGMRERAATVGGTLRTGAATGGGFLVEARLPVRAEALA